LDNPTPKPAALNTRQNRPFPDAGLHLTRIPPEPVIQGRKHNEDVTQMNEVHRCASRRVQRAAPRVIGMIDEPGHPTVPS
jgi:hypothetical protein